ncbi:hypothetical protein SI65_07195 [Aspergillus cristatus]|uniref:Chromo domain-containing protein n=1 Tax=Aspergillus cristatus TaxID=573508 RepID=A0A1E3B968_ASPCR|nr:hypothetical protein SI65_07195 [Aspergillus cristatus]
MPPPLEETSDGESTGGSIPYANNDEQQQTPDDADQSGEEGEEGEEEEGVYIVEQIVGHDFLKDGTLLLQVKWKGYEDPADQTMEPEENLLDGAKDLVEEYYRVQGGRPEKPAPKKRKSVGRPKQTPEKAAPKRQKKSDGNAIGTPTSIAGEENENEDVYADWTPNRKSWENDVQSIETIMREAETSILYAYIQWKDGRKSKVSLETCYEKCPKKMLKFYEAHLVFKEG